LYWSPPTLQLPGISVTPALDVVATLLRGKESHWSFDREGLSTRLPLGALDDCAWNVVTHIVRRRRSVVLTVPRVEPGISIGPAIRLLVGMTLQKHHRVPESERVPLEPGQRIALLGRAHSTRHLFAESVLRFNQSPTYLCAFPTARLNRKGELDPALFGRVLRKHRQAVVAENLGVEIHDLGPVSADVELPSVAVALVELFEHDNPTTLERLAEFVRRSSVQSVIAFVNALDLRKGQHLADSGYHVMPLRSFAFTGSAPLPTFTALDTAAANAMCYDAGVVPEAAPASRALLLAHFRLTDALRACGGSDPPFFLRQAWHVLDTLSSVAAPIDVYNASRRALGRTSLAKEIERLRSPRILHGEARVAVAVMSGWTHVCAALGAALAELSNVNPLFELVADRVLDEGGDLTVAIADKANRDALLTELVVGYGWRPGRVVIEHLPRLSRSCARAQRVLTVGVDGTRRSHTCLWALLPDEVEAVTYPHSVRRHVRWVDACNEQFRRTLPEHAVMTGRLVWGQSSIEATGLPAGRIEASIVVPDLIASRTRVTEDDEREWAMVPAAGPSFPPAPTEDDLLPDDPDAFDQDGFDGDPVGERVSVRFTDGGTHSFSVAAEVLVVDGDSLEPRSVTRLASGDELLFIADGSQRSAFETVRGATRHLIDADDRVLEWWGQSLNALRRRYPPTESDSRSRFVTDVYAKGCGKEASTIASWLEGGVLAPRDRSDIEALIALSGLGDDARLLSGRVHQEVTTIRTFQRQLGMRFRARLAGRSPRAEDAVSSAIDEFLDDVEHRVIASVVSVQPLP